MTKLLDFGLVKPMAEPPSDQPSPEGAITGSPLYMSPEQASGSQHPDRRGDLYSLGAVAYYLLTGRPPFQGETAMSVMMAHARDPVAPPSHVRPGIPADLERVVLRCLAKDPADRYPGCREPGERPGRLRGRRALDTAPGRPLVALGALPADADAGTLPRAQDQRVRFLRPAPDAGSRSIREGEAPAEPREHAARREPRPPEEGSPVILLRTAHGIPRRHRPPRVRLRRGL